MRKPESRLPRVSRITLVGGASCAVLLATISQVTTLNAADPNAPTASSNPSSAVIWRAPRYGGLNCLLLLFYLHGNTTDYGDCVKLIGADRPPHTAPEIMEAAARLDFPLKARAVSPEELDTIPLPVIVHLAGDNPKEGLFCVLLGRNPSRMCVMSGPDAAVVSMNRELFLRSWSGTIMYPRRQRLFLATPTSIALVIAVVCVLLLRRYSKSI